VPDPDDYLAISDYGAIGNLRTCALIGRNAAIDWCCLPELDSPSVFGAILDRRRGGTFRIAPAGAGLGEQRYVGDTNVLETAFTGNGTRLEVTDFMPLTGDIEGIGGSTASPEIHRLLGVHGGALHVEIVWSPRFDYARAGPVFHAHADGWVAEAGGDRLTLSGIGEADAQVVERGDGPAVVASLRLDAGETRALVTRWNGDHADRGVAETRRLLDATLATWSGWVRTGRRGEGGDWVGSFRPLLVRSELALKLLTHADSGAIAAAATTSLPEEIGGVRNWDYRYTWIRDASLTAQALIALGHSREATEFLFWAERAAQARARDDWSVQIMYGLHGETDLDEFELEHMEGYRASRPVRVGNAAVEQRQLDVYGELVGSAYELVRHGAELDPSLCGFLSGLADRAAASWQQPDYGIWEVRRDPMHFVYSKVMIWVALDRAIALSRLGVIQGSEQAWRIERERVRRNILENGFDPAVGAFTQSFGEPPMDAANLLIPIYEFLPFDDARIQGTIDRIIDELVENDLVYRYKADDGLPGGEGAFGLCTYWLVDNLALAGRVDEAWRIFERMSSHANHVGLLSEQVDTASGAFLGNFPQAFSHIGLINSSLYLAHAEGRPLPEPALLGTPAHRAHRERLNGLAAPPARAP
jgi:pentatricopeptide repeat protein